MNRAVVLFLLCFVQACGTMQGYKGEAQPAEETAVVEWSNWSGGVKVKSLDGELPSFASSAQVLPGEHIVNITHSPNLGLSTYSATLTFDAEAGRVYEIAAECGTLVKCRPFWAWIEDAEAEKIVAGRRPE